MSDDLITHFTPENFGEWCREKFDRFTSDLHPVADSGDFAKAIEAFQAAIKEDPKDAVAHRELAKCYSSTGKYSKAVEELKTYLKMKPDAEDKATYETAIKGLSALKDK